MRTSFSLLARETPRTCAVSAGEANSVVMTALAIASSDNNRISSILRVSISNFNVLRDPLSTQWRSLASKHSAMPVSGSSFAFRGLDEIHGNSRHATDNRSLSGIADVLRPAF